MLRWLKQKWCAVINIGHCFHNTGKKTQETGISPYCKLVEDTYEISERKCCMCEVIGTKKKHLISRAIREENK